LLNTWKQEGKNETSRQTDSGGPLAADTAQKIYHTYSRRMGRICGGVLDRNRCGPLFNQLIKKGGHNE